MRSGRPPGSGTSEICTGLDRESKTFPDFQSDRSRDQKGLLDTPHSRTADLIQHSCLLPKSRLHLILLCVTGRAPFDRVSLTASGLPSVGAYTEILNKLLLTEQRLFVLHEPLSLVAHSQVSTGIQPSSTVSALPLRTIPAPAKQEVAA